MEKIEESPVKVPERVSQPEALILIPEAMARKYNVMPLAIVDNTMRVAMVNPTDILALEALATRSKMRIEPEPASAKEVQEAIDFNYKSYDEIEKQISNISISDKKINEKITLDTAAEAPVAQALTLIIDEAVKARASDIHLQPQEDKLQVRYRIDGTLHDILQLPMSTALLLISRIKILANMNIADHHRPQDGQFSIKTKAHRSIDIRVGTIATVYGEMAVLRLLDKSRVSLAMSELGFLEDSLERYQNMLKTPYGMILVSGPTGAGKTTTLYASVNFLDHVGQNIITIEDPVEYRFKGINQIQVNPRAGLTFASGLRSILRLDPDVVLVGEIRDSETANIAIQSALTGHLVLSSIHASDAVGVVFRLIDLGIEPFLVSSALIGVVAQRMVRQICSHCSGNREVSLLEQRIFTKETGEECEEFASGTGCSKCADTGYRGRTGIFEILSMSDETKMMLLDGANAVQLRNRAVQDGMVPLLKDGMLKVKRGITTPGEVVRNAYSIE